MRILLVGSGGREHALAHTFVRQGHQVYCIPGNAGIDEICEKIPPEFSKIRVQDVDKFPQIAKQLQVDLTVVGPEDPLSRGIVDHFNKENLPIFGPTKKAAQLESSKAFAKDFMKKHSIPTAFFEICHSPTEAKSAVEKIFTKGNKVVIKPSGLTAGKGVTLCQSKEEAFATIQLLMEEGKYQAAGQELVVEEMLYGREVSILAFCDGKRIVPMLPSQDHKRVNNDDQGPNTGGMGAYAPVPFAHQDLLDQIYQKIILPTQKGFETEKILYQGVLYFGIMVTADGPMILEYNCRFGDPETEALLPLLESDLAEIMLACYQGKLAEKEIHWTDQSACCVVMASGGYPESYETGFSIMGLEDVKSFQDVLVFHAGTIRDLNGEVKTAGGRVLAVTGRGDNLDQAISHAYAAISHIQFKNAHFRTDIAQKMD